MIAMLWTSPKARPVHEDRTRISANYSFPLHWRLISRDTVVQASQIAKARFSKYRHYAASQMTAIANFDNA
jgi:hypothetical protein